MESYKNLQIYREAPKSLKRSIEAYIKTNKPTNEQMYLQLQLFEQNSKSKKEKKAANGIWTIVVLVLTIGFTLAIDKTNSPAMTVTMLVFLIVLLIVFYSGVFSEYKMQVRKIKKKLSKLPYIPEFTGTEKLDK